MRVAVPGGACGWLATRRCADRIGTPVRAGPTGPPAGAGRPSRHRPPPTVAGRGRARSGWRCRLAEVGEDVAHGHHLGDEGDDPHRAPTRGAPKRDHFVDAGQQQRPGMVGGAAVGEPGLDVLPDAAIEHALARAAWALPRGCAVPGPALALHACPLCPAFRRWGSGWAARCGGRHWPQGSGRAAQTEN